MRFFLIILIIFIKNSISFAYSGSDYWSLKKNGPSSSSEAINIFSKKNKIQPLEGVWFQNEFGNLAIVSVNEGRFGDHLIYKIYIIDNKDTKLNGINKGSIIRTKYEDLFTVFEVLEYSKKIHNNNSVAVGTLRLLKGNFAEIKLDINGKQIKKYNIIRKYPKI
jgi:hypothetical protein